MSPGWMAQLVGVLSHTPESCWFDFWLEHMPGLWVRFPVWVCMGGSWLTFLSHIDVSLSLSPTSPSLSKINKNISSDGDLKKKVGGHKKLRKAEGGRAYYVIRWCQISNVWQCERWGAKVAGGYRDSVCENNSNIPFIVCIGCVGHLSQPW